MLSRTCFAASLVLLSIAFHAGAGEPQRWVPPPAPSVIEGSPIVPVVEVFGGAHYILHLPKPEQADWRRTRYDVALKRNGEQRFHATLATTPFVKDDEVVFFTLPQGSADEFIIEVIDPSGYPFRKVWSGAVGSIKVMAD